MRKTFTFVRVLFLCLTGLLLLGLAYQTFSGTVSETFKSAISYHSIIWLGTLFLLTSIEVGVFVWEKLNKRTTTLDYTDPNNKPNDLDSILRKGNFTGEEYTRDFDEIKLYMLDYYCKGAREGTLPEWFNSWDLHYYSGWSVAHEALRYNNLPVDIKKLNLTKVYDLSLEDIKLYDKLTNGEKLLADQEQPPTDIEPDEHYHKELAKSLS